MKQLIKKVKQISMLLLVISLIGCENDDDNYPKVIAGFTYTINADTGTVTFINTSVNTRNYFWSFGDGTSSTEINPIKTYSTGEYLVTLKATNAAGASDTSEDTIVISDVGAPIITLLGDTTINMMVGETFTDPGATATDDEDGDITANIVVAGAIVDVNTVGTYIITYNVSDAAGNAATQRTRTVIVAEAALTCPETLLVLPIDFDCDGIDYASKDTGDVAFEVIDNPELSGINATPSKVAKLVFDANQPWENMNLNLDTPISFTTDKSVKLKLFSSTARAVKLKFETGGAAVEDDQNHTGSGWEELTFTIASADSYSNLILFVDGGSDTTGTFYVDDIEQVASAPPVASGDYLYATTGTVTIASVISDWGSGTGIVSDYSGDGTYNPSIQLTSGTGWGDVSALAFTEIEAGKILEYTTLEFKIKTTDYTTIKVKMPGATTEEPQFTISDGTTLADGWVQMSIPLSEFGTIPPTIPEFAILEFGAGTILITDVMLSGEGSVPPPSNCPAPPAGELLSNGDFEAGDVGCWQFFPGTSISTTINNGGSKSAEIQGKTGAAVGLKQERFAAGILLPNTSYTVSFDIIASGAFGEGGVFKAFTFSEGADGGTVAATQHILADGVTSLATTWEKKTYTFTTAANANQVEGGLSFYMEIVNSAVKLNVDNVVIKKTP